MGALLVNLGRESGSHDAPLLFSVSHTSQGSPAGIATTLRDPPPPRRVCYCLVPATGCGGLRWSALSRLPAVLRSPSRALLIPVLLRFPLLRTGLCVHSERQWKETPARRGWYVQTNG